MKKGQKTTGQVKLPVTVRTLLGKKVKKLRREGNLPANIFGTDFKSQSVSMKYTDFAQVYKIVHETGIVYLQLDKAEIPTLVKHIQRHPLDSTVLHVDFRKIDLSKKILTSVPVKVTGISEAIAQKGGILLTLSPHLEVEALPQDIPTAIEVDISVIKELGQEIKVSQLVKSPSFTIMTDAEKVVVSVTAHKEESIIAETTATAAPEVITAKPEGEEGAETDAAEGKAGQAAAPAPEKKEAAKK